MAKSAQEYTDKLIRRTQGSTEDYKRGIMSTTSDPMQLAKAAIPKMKLKIAEAIDNGKVARGLDRVSKSDWQRAAADLGSTRLSAGIEAARPKIAAFAAEFLPFQESVTNATRALPSNTLEDGIARATAQIRGTAKFRRTR